MSAFLSTWKNFSDCNERNVHCIQDMNESKIIFCIFFWTNFLFVLKLDYLNQVSIIIESNLFQDHESLAIIEKEGTYLQSKDFWYFLLSTRVRVKIIKLKDALAAKGFNK